MCSESQEAGSVEQTGFKRRFKEYLEDLQECLGMMVVGSILFAVLAALAHYDSANGAHLKAELIAHQQVFLGINQQAAGLAVFFCGIFFMTAGSPNATLFAERLVIPFVSFLRDGSAIATGAFFADLGRFLVVYKNDAGAAMLASLQGFAGWLTFTCATTGTVFMLKWAKNNHNVKLNYGTVAAGAICLVIGVVFIFG